jgi:hypothetical protein
MDEGVEAGGAEMGRGSGGAIAHPWHHLKLGHIPRALS